AVLPWDDPERDRRPPRHLADARVPAPGQDPVHAAGGTGELGAPTLLIPDRHREPGVVGGHRVRLPFEERPQVGFVVYDPGAHADAGVVGLRQELGAGTGYRPPLW